MSQETAKTNTRGASSKIVELRQQFTEQRVEIGKLRQERKNEAELRAKQQSEIEERLATPTSDLEIVENLELISQ